MAIMKRKNRKRKWTWRNRIAPTVEMTEDFHVDLAYEEKDRVIDDEKSTVINSAIAALPEKYRVIVLLYYMEEVPQERIAAILHVPVGTVKSRLYAARKLLKSELEDYFLAFLDTITPENIDEYFVRDEEIVLTAKPDENGWIDFGSRYNKREDYVMEGGKGYIEYWIDDGEDFRITSFGISGMGDEEDTGILEMSDVQISVIVRNDDGSFTTAVYRGKEGLFSISDRTWQ